MRMKGGSKRDHSEWSGASEPAGGLTVCVGDGGGSAKRMPGDLVDVKKGPRLCDLAVSVDCAPSVAASWGIELSEDAAGRESASVNQFRAPERYATHPPTSRSELRIVASFTKRHCCFIRIARGLD